MSNEPYRGPRPYQVQDRGLFYGRERDVDRLRVLLLGNSVSVLHAPSGAGKTSLLRAALIPALEAERRSVVICQPGPTPVEVVRAAVINRLLPAPSTELEILERLRTKLTQKEISRSTSLARVKGSYRTLQPHEDSYRELVENVPLPKDSPLRIRGAPVDTTPYLARFLYLKVGSPSLIHYLAYLETGSNADTDLWRRAARLQSGREIQKLMEEQTLGDLIDFFESRRLAEWHHEAVSTLLNSNATLPEFFAHVIRQMSTRHAPFEIVLILDQFEEFFTLFGETSRVLRRSSRELMDYRRRDELFKQLGSLVRLRRPSLYGIPSKLPVRLLVALRDDYLARLDELERYVSPIEAQAKHHLTVLRAGDAERVIRAPARSFGYDYENEVFEAIRDGLTEDGHKIEPGHVQIVCQRLWNSQGKSLHQEQLERYRQELAKGSFDLSATPDKPRITSRDFNSEDMGGLSGILDTHFRGFLDAYGDERAKLDILDMLAPLITTWHTRNIVMKEVVVQRRFVKEALREQFLDDLRRHNIVRVETHRSGDLVDISHEFLIDAIEVETVRTKRDHREWESLRAAFDKLKIIERAGFRSAWDALRPAELRALYWYRDRLDPAEVGSWLAELALRCCIAQLSDAEKDRTRMLKHWSERIDASPILLQAGELIGDLNARLAKGRFFDHLELAVLTSADPAMDLEPKHEAFLLQSAIRNSDAETTATIASWLRE